MFVINNIDELNKVLSETYAERISKKAAAGMNLHKIIRGPVGLFLIREDGAGGSKLADEVVGSYGFWDRRSGEFFDGIFLGWGLMPEGPQYDANAFAGCVASLEKQLNWSYRGGANLILTDFVFDTTEMKGEVDFSRASSFDITGLMEKKKFPQLSVLLEEVMKPARKRAEQNLPTTVWEISDYIGMERTWRYVWEELVKKIGMVLGWADDLAPYAVRDMRRDKS